MRRGGDVARAERVDEVGRSMPERIVTASLGPDARDADQLLEEGVFDLREESEEGERVLADRGCECAGGLPRPCRADDRRSRLG
jgi:hypothetical protein